MAVHLFRKVPPLELLEELVKALHFEGLEDSRWFQKTDISLEIFEDFLPIIEPYYIPCKAKLFLHEFTQAKAITVLRHLFRAHAYDIHSQEKVLNQKKITQYQFQCPRTKDISGVTISFL
jgi:hypothetical protein